MTAPGQYTTRMVAQGEEVAGTGKIIRLGLGIDHGLDGGRPVVGGNAGGGSFGIVHRDGESGLVRIGSVLEHHQGHSQVVQPFPDDRHAQQSLGLGDDEVDRLGRHHFGGHYQIAFVLPVFIIDYDQEPAGLHFLQALFQTTQRHMSVLPLRRDQWFQPLAR